MNTVCPANTYRDFSTTSICTQCDCDPTGSTSLQCDTSGICECESNYTGDKCSECATNHYLHSSTGTCADCACDATGAESLQCNANGICTCNTNYTGEKCSSNMISKEFRNLY